MRRFLVECAIRTFPIAAIAALLIAGPLSSVSGPAMAVDGVHPAQGRLTPGPQLTPASPHHKAHLTSHGSPGGGGGHPHQHGILPYAYVPEPITSRTNVAAIAQDFAGSAAAGISWKFRWSDLETSPGAFDWTPVDNALAASAAVHKPAILRVIAGMYSPSWVLNQVPTVRVPNFFFPNPSPFPNPTVIPVVWNPSYLSDWSTFISALGARYDSHSGIYLVEASGAGVIGDMYLPPDMAVWDLAGYSDTVLLNAWQQIINAYDRAFVKHPVALGIDQPLVCDFGTRGFVNPTCLPSFSSNVMGPLVTWLHAATGHHVYLQNNGLKAKYLADGVHYLRKALREATSYTKTGYQVAGTIGSVTELHDAFTVAIMDGVSYVEVYPDNILGAAYRADLAYLRSG